MKESEKKKESNYVRELFRNLLHTLVTMLMLVLFSLPKNVFVILPSWQICLLVGFVFFVYSLIGSQLFGRLMNVCGLNGMFFTILVLFVVYLFVLEPFKLYLVAKTIPTFKVTHWVVYIAHMLVSIVFNAKIKVNTKE